MFVKFADLEIANYCDGNTRLIELLAPVISKETSAIKIIGSPTSFLVDEGGEMEVTAVVTRQFLTDDEIMHFVFRHSASLLQRRTGALEICDFGGMNYKFTGAVLTGAENEISGVSLVWTYKFNVREIQC